MEYSNFNRVVIKGARDLLSKCLEISELNVKTLLSDEKNEIDENVLDAEECLLRAAHLMLDSMLADEDDEEDDEE